MKLFFIDDARLDGTSDPPKLNFDADSGIGNEVSDSEDTGARRKSDAMEPLKPTRKAKKTAWVDPDDATLSVSLSDAPRLRKLRDNNAEDVVGGSQYEAKLRRAFEKLNPAPTWATAARKKVRLAAGEPRKRQRSDAGSAADDVDSVEDDADVDVSALLTRTDGILREGRGKMLEKGVLSIERLRDGNISAQAEGEIKALAFHPLPRVPVLMTASSDRRVRLFKVSHSSQ